MRFPGSRGREQTAIRVRTQGGQRSAGAGPWLQGGGGGGSGFNKSDGRQCRPSFLQLLLPKLVKTRKGHMTLRKLGKVSVQAGLGRGAFSQA